ncbi:MAG: arginine repressor, partial [Proteobacteria bacterium]|nr:arginine repressor [Pseudomonadota bacterium]
TESNDIIQRLKQLLVAGMTNTQEDLCAALKKQGFEVNQSKVSRLLRRVGAVKTKNEKGEIVYRLAKEPAPPTKETPLSDLILSILNNETMVVIRTSPGSASLVARLLDYQQEQLGILGTIAGDDTILVIPKTIKKTQKLMEELQELLY